MSQENLNASGSHSRNSPPHLPSESPGSSVSSFYQNEYAELLKYAVGLPGADLAARGHEMAAKTSVFKPIVISRSQGSSARQTPVYDNPEGGEFSNINTNSVYPTVQSNEEDLTSHCEDEDSNFNKTKRVVKIKKCKTKVSDQAVQDMSCKLDGWLGQLKCDILDQLCNSINTTSIEVTKLHEKEKQDLISEKECLAKEVNRLCEMMCTMEKSLCRKDKLIDNITAALSKEKKKTCKAKAFYACKAVTKEKKAKKFTEKLATNFHNNQLRKKVMKGWFGLIQQKWKDRTEKMCQTKAQSVCTELASDYEDKIKRLNQHSSCLEAKIQTLLSEQEQYSQQVKKAFMRGVCALNMEAMTAFGTDDGRCSDIDPCTNLNDNNPDFLQPLKSDYSMKSLPVDPTKAAVPEAPLSRQVQSLPVFASYEKPQSVGGPRIKPQSAAPRLPSQGVTLAPPMASIVVERHDPITKQTIGKATAVRYPKKTGKEDKSQKSVTLGLSSKSQPSAVYKPLAGQIGYTKSIKIVD